MADIEQYISAVNTLEDIAVERVAMSGFLGNAFVLCDAPRIVKRRGCRFYDVEFTYESRYGGGRTTTTMRSTDDAIQNRIRRADKIAKKFGGDGVAIIPSY